MKRILVAFLTVVVAPGLVDEARADEKTARAEFDEGERAYNLGQFAKAVDHFTKAYSEWPEPAFLFNLAQTYRQAGDCKQASFFYKRFLALKENDAKKPIKPELRAEVEKRITELDECVKRELASKPPTALDNGGGTPTGGGKTGPGTGGRTGTGTGGTATGGGEGDEGEGDEGEGEGDEGEGDGLTPPSDNPKIMSVRVGLGAAKLSAGNLDTPVQFAGSLIGGYPLAIGPKFLLELGAGIAFTPVPYTTTSGESGAGALFGIFANVGPAITVAPKIAVRADVGVGVQLFSGLSMDGNPFTMDGAPATGALSSVLVRAGISGDYAVTPNIVVTVTPIVFAYSPAPAGFEEEISTLSTLSFMAGVAYRR